MPNKAFFNVLRITAKCLGEQDSENGSAHGSAHGVQEEGSCVGLPAGHEDIHSK